MRTFVLFPSTTLKHLEVHSNNHIRRPLPMITFDNVDEQQIAREDVTWWSNFSITVRVFRKAVRLLHKATSSLVNSTGIAGYLVI